MVYVALLRGINVGGKNKVSMAELRQVFEKAGLEQATTYINSGNVIFKSALQMNGLAELLETAVEKAFSFPVKVLVCEGSQFVSIASAIPADWVNDTTMKCDVMFLWQSIDNPDILKQLPIKPDIDRVRYKQGALIWSVDRPAVTKSGMLKIIGTDAYKQMTIRNCNTVRKLATMVEALGR